VKTITIIDSLVLPGIGYDRRQACSQPETEELTSEYGGVDSYLDFYLYISFLEVSTPHRVGENEGRLFDQQHNRNGNMQLNMTQVFSCL
jgi:hypothetical protein